MKHGVITKKGIISATIVVVAMALLGAGSVSADKAHAEMIAQEKAIAAAQAEREAKLAMAKFEPVVTFEGYEALDIGDNVPGIYAKDDAAAFNAQIKADIEAEEARKAAEAEAKAKAEKEAKEKAERDQREREEQARLEAADQNNSSTESSNSGSDDTSADNSKDESSESGSSEGESSDSGSSGGNYDVSVLYKYVGCQYVYGGTSPSSGWDCSGFVQYVMKNEFGVSVSRTSGGQAGNGYGVSVSDRSQWKPGDLLIYRAGNGNIGHVAIYLGGGQMIHALNEKHDTFVQSVSAYDSWDSNTLVKVRRVLP